MSKRQQAYAVTAICISIIIAGAIIAYKPDIFQQKQALPSGFRYPSGVGVSQGTQTLTTGTSQTGDDTKLKTISLTGAGSASAQADQAKVNLGVQITKESAKEAIGENADSMSAVIEAIKALGVGEDDIVTTSYTVYPQYDWTENGRVFKGFTVTNLVQVTVKDLDIVGDVVDAAAGAGANQINGISFELSDAKREELKSNAYVAALSDAEDKAQIIAETLKLSITGVQSVIESSYVPVRTYEYAEAAGADLAPRPAPTPIISGELAVTVNVHIVFLFE
jgi:uncharacterized protein YggE